MYSSNDVFKYFQNNRGNPRVIGDKTGDKLTRCNLLSRIFPHRKRKRIFHAIRRGFRWWLDESPHFFFQGIFFGKPRCSCFQGYQTNDPLIRLHTLFHRFCGMRGLQRGGGKKRKMAMDSANESMYEDSRNKIPPSFRNSLSNFPFGEKEGIVYLILSESHFPKARSCRESTSCAILQEKKKRKKRKRKELEE